ncbi:MAG: hypothetical protein P9L88_08870 [Candidatus Tantalella remota]|nr:hypothetical protein [Candidatus Tantalella remota]
MEKEEKEKEIVERPEELAWYFRGWMIVSAILVFGPLGLLLLWFRPGVRMYIKVLVSVVVIGFTVWMSFWMAEYYNRMMDHYRELADSLDKG